jgi:RNA polymerase sigma-70 factor, ECF subfamily
MRNGFFAKPDTCRTQIRACPDLLGIDPAETRAGTMGIVDAQQLIPTTDGTEGFSKIAEQNMPVIFRFLLASLRDPDLAQTLTQECFLRAYRSRATFRGESSVKTWLMRIAINLQKDYWRNRRIQFWRETRANAVDVDLVSDHLPSAERSPEAQLLAREQVARIWKIVPCLSVRERSVFLLRYVEELELKEIGNCTGLKIGAVKVYLARALAKMRAALDEH